MMNPQTFIYLSRPRPGVVDPSVLSVGCWASCSCLRDEYDWCPPSYQGSPDIGDEPDDQRP
jgi:hypothetical protein